MAVRAALRCVVRTAGIATLLVAITVGCDASTVESETPAPMPPPIVDIPPGVTPPQPPGVVVEKVLRLINANELWLGQRLVPARIVRIIYRPGGFPYKLRLSDGREDPHGRGQGGNWVVEAEGTFAFGRDGIYPGSSLGDPRPGDPIERLAVRAVIGFDDNPKLMDDFGIRYIACWDVHGEKYPEMLDTVSCGPPHPNP